MTGMNRMADGSNRRTPDQNAGYQSRRPRRLGPASVTLWSLDYSGGRGNFAGAHAATPFTFTGAAEQLAALRPHRASS